METERTVNNEEESVIITNNIAAFSFRKYHNAVASDFINIWTFPFLKECSDWMQSQHLAFFVHDHFLLAMYAQTMCVCVITQTLADLKTSPCICLGITAICVFCLCPHAYLPNESISEPIRLFKKHYHKVKIMTTFLYCWKVHSFLQTAAGTHKTCLSNCSIWSVIVTVRSDLNDSYYEGTVTVTMIGLPCSSHIDMSAVVVFIGCLQHITKSQIYFIKGWSASWLIISAGNKMKRKSQKCWEILTILQWEPPAKLCKALWWKQCNHIVIALHGMSSLVA